MPFRSKAQARFMFAKHPELAQEFASHTKSIKSLPQHVSAKNESPNRGGGESKHEAALSNKVMKGASDAIAKIMKTKTSEID